MVSFYDVTGVDCRIERRETRKKDDAEHPVYKSFKHLFQPLRNRKGPENELTTTGCITIRKGQENKIMREKKTKKLGGITRFDGM